MYGYGCGPGELKMYLLFLKWVVGVWFIMVSLLILLRLDRIIKLLENKNKS